MSLNSSSPSNSSLGSVPLNCSSSNVSFLIGSAFIVTKAFLLIPLSILILYLGHQRWRRQHSFTTTSHSDIFTYHMAAIELIGGLGSAFFFCGSSVDLPQMVIAGYCLSFINFCGENFFHLLTCVERYLAVVHPVTYLGLRNVRGVRIRNISIGCAWLLCFVWTGTISLHYPTSPTVLFFSPLVFSLVVMSFCSISVLRVLIRPGPGEGGKDKERADLSKQRVFVTILAIMGVLWLWFVGFLVSYALDTLVLLSPSVSCVVKASAFWFTLPSSLVLPLLYLQRAGKLSCCCYNSG
ncbi:uncharacterized protein LOC122870239 isoform X1 [Siniperca chuatsi]|uniref:uncharacterized protein LOC122870239 isoform X1 n=1 Tax=Siniperca chuatsi TaxID=119488 RepID=UPI001CE0A507|nr:uncharacterized protein LOC122870239 isoform X1 [Siniperca chuatsi]XP_044040235.1 uncharacterized protein LOC122870239 isoform X1 [Siniperca chuatsi]